MKIKIFNYTLKITKNRGKYNKTWTPPNKLDAPEAPEGYRYRWIRDEVLRGRWGMKKYKDHGWDLVKPKRGEKNMYPTISEGRFKGYIGVGGLILASVPEKVFEERDRFLKGLN
jgi:hypothetical protein